MVPKKRTTENELGERVKKKRRDEGKKPATCTACGLKFISKAKYQKGFIQCLQSKGCGNWKAKYD